MPKCGVLESPNCAGEIFLNFTFFGWKESNCPKKVEEDWIYVGISAERDWVLYHDLDQDFWKK